MPASYAAIVVALDNALARQKILGQDVAIDSVTIARLPAGSDVSLRIGQAADPIPVSEGDNFSELCGELGGLWYDVGTAAPGDTMTVIVFFDQGNLTRGV